MSKTWRWRRWPALLRMLSPREIGTITEIHLDSENHLIQFHGQLLGARDEIRVTLRDYHLQVLDDCAPVTNSSVAASPPWIAGLLNRHVRGRALRVPISDDAGAKKALQSGLFRLLGSLV
jgi:hypothetical protein